MGQGDEQPTSLSCPVDQTARAAWLNVPGSAPSPKIDPPAALSKKGTCDSSTIDRSSSAKQVTALSSKSTASGQLATHREVSSIPRAKSAEGSFKLANNEQETGSSMTGNWIYPSEQMFFNAMRRKQHDPKGEDMKVIVPIHNAVNERAWGEIQKWEKGHGAEKCGGPRLHSFSGDSSAMSPKARLNTLLGYSAPFDRHDWVVDRCGTKVEYIIDFYSGKDDGTGKGLSFYLDVRPKANSWEGIRMRLAKAMGRT